VQLAQAETLREQPERACLHQRGPRFVDVARRRAVLGHGCVFLGAREFEALPGRVLATLRGHDRRHCRCIAAGDEQQFLALAITRDNVHFRHWPELPAGEVDVEHRRGLHEHHRCLA
jgi:hypothetical protein